MSDYFLKGSVIRRVNGEPALGLMAGRALMLQLAHPVVAQGVVDHSNFKQNPFKRLQGTVEAMYAIVFGSEELVAGLGRRMRWLHDFVKGPNYRALDPENLLWVHATLVDSALIAYTTYVGQLSSADLETYYEEMTRVAEVFGCPRDAQPANIAEFRTYFDNMVKTIEVSDTSRDLGGWIMRPQLRFKLQVPLAPSLAFHRLITVGTMPEPLRDQLGWEWDEQQQRRFERWQGLLRGTTRVTPRPVRSAAVWAGGRPLIWSAKRHNNKFEAKLAARATLRD